MWLLPGCPPRSRGPEPVPARTRGESSHRRSQRIPPIPGVTGDPTRTANRLPRTNPFLWMGAVTLGHPICTPTVKIKTPGTHGWRHRWTRPWSPFGGGETFRSTRFVWDSSFHWVSAHLGPEAVDMAESDQNIPTAWFIAAFLPLPPKPLPSDLEVGTRTSAMDLRIQNRVLNDEKRRYENALWWRRLNRFMIPPGIVIFIVIVSSRQPCKARFEEPSTTWSLFPGKKKKKKKTRADSWIRCRLPSPSWGQRWASNFLDHQSSDIFL